MYREREREREKGGGGGKHRRMKVRLLDFYRRRVDEWGKCTLSGERKKGSHVVRESRAMESWSSGYFVRRTNFSLTCWWFLRFIYPARRH